MNNVIEKLTLRMLNCNETYCFLIEMSNGHRASLEIGRGQRAEDLAACLEDAINSLSATDYKAELRKAKARLYYLLTKFPPDELTDDSQELDMMFCLSRDKDMQDIFQKALQHRRR